MEEMYNQLAIVANYIGIAVLLYTIYFIIKAWFIVKIYIPINLKDAKDFRCFKNNLVYVMAAAVMHLLMYVAYSIDEPIQPLLDIGFTITYVFPFLILISILKEQLDKYDDRELKNNSYIYKKYKNDNY